MRTGTDVYSSSRDGNGMVSLGPRLTSATKEEISKQESKDLRQMVISATRPRNQWAAQEFSTVDSGKAYAREIAHHTPTIQRPSSGSPTSTSSPSPGATRYSNGNYSDYSSGSSHKSPSPPSTLRPTHPPYSTLSSTTGFPSGTMSSPGGGDDIRSRTSASPLGYSYRNGNAIPPASVQYNGAPRPTNYPPTNLANPSPNYTAGHSSEPLQYRGVQQQGMVGRTFSYGTTSNGHNGRETYVTSGSTNVQPAAEFPKVDVMNAPPTRYTSPPSTSDSSALADRSGKFPRNGTSYPEYGRESSASNGSAGTHSLHRPQLSNEERTARWREMEGLLHRQDENFGRLAEQIAQDMEREKRNKTMIGSCRTCRGPLYVSEEVTVAGEVKYHPNCFNCERCGRNLRNLKFYVFDEQILCQEDFLLAELHKRAQKCSVCQQPIVEMVLQAVDRVFHPACFRCSVCQKCLDGVQFAVDDKEKVYCMADYHEKFAPRCYVCRKTITPKQGSGETVRVVALGNDYHLECYACEGCGRQLGEEHNERCHPLNGHLLCKNCHVLWKQTGGAPTTDL